MIGSAIEKILNLGRPAPSPAPSRKGLDLALQMAARDVLWDRYSCEAEIAGILGSSPSKNFLEFLCGSSGRDPVMALSASEELGLLLAKAKGAPAPGKSGREALLGLLESVFGSLGIESPSKRPSAREALRQDWPQKPWDASALLRVQGRSLEIRLWNT